MFFDPNYFFDWGQVRAVWPRLPQVRHFLGALLRDSEEYPSSSSWASIAFLCTSKASIAGCFAFSYCSFSLFTSSIALIFLFPIVDDKQILALNRCLSIKKSFYCNTEVTCLLTLPPLRNCKKFANADLTSTV